MFALLRLALFLRRFLLGRLTGRSFLHGLAFRAIGAFELQQHFVAQPETLLPGIHLVSRLLGSCFVGAEVENENRLWHAPSIATRC